LHPTGHRADRRSAAPRAAYALPAQRGPQHGTFEAQIAIAEEYLAPLGIGVRDKVMFNNALAFYRRHKPSHHHD
jgi:hypothetical protein